MRRTIVMLLLAMAGLVAGMSGTRALAQGPTALPVDPGPHAVGTAHHPLFVKVLGYDQQGRPILASQAVAGNSPADVRTAYGFSSLSADGSGTVIGVVDAYDAPTAASDLETFITQFGIPQMNGLPGQPSCTVANGPWPCFQVVAPQGKLHSNAGWALETSLDTQWAHAIAPGASILLVQASSSSLSNLFGAVDTAVANGANVVSMSWGGSESSSDPSYDAHFNQPGVVFTASSGDSGTGVIYPSSSPYVLGVGGTTLNANGTETAWSGSGGGVSTAEAEPGYQSAFAIPSTGGARGVPDVAYDADPNTGFAVYDSTRYQGQSGWWVVGGTSAGAPQWAALTALADQGRATPLSTADLAASPFYAAATASYAANYRDITSGTNGSCGTVCTAAPGYDFVTGLGSPLAGSLVPALNGAASPPAATLTSIAVTPASASIATGATQQFIATGTYSDGSTQDLTASVTWTSSDATVATISSSGLATGVSAGSATITAALSGVSGTAGLTVTQASSATTVGVTSIAYSTSGGRNHDKNLSITLTVEDNTGAPVSGASVSIAVALDGSPLTSGTATTGSTGTVTFTQHNAASGTYTTAVTNVSATGLTWDGQTPPNSFTK